ncbi:hypothetical protein MMC25_008326 [Agyrium rufum]|nr:hypothetical protein [Agyrium rufum]
MGSDFDETVSSKHLLEDFASTEENINHFRRQQSRGWLMRYGLTILYTTLIFLLLTTNTFSLFRVHQLQLDRYSGASKFTQLTYDTPKIYRSRTEYWGENETLADELWDSIDVSPLTVALTDEWAQDQGLEVSESRFPWDDSKGLYFLKAFHLVHCLKVMRKAFVDHQRGNPPLINPEHVHHCLDALRQDVMCMADDTPMPTILEPDSIGNGQARMCKSWDKLIEWTQAPDRNACYRRLTDYVPIRHKLERFAFCPKDSPSYPVMSAYFDKWGHKDPFAA